MTLKEISKETDIKKGVKIRNINSNGLHIVEGKLPNGTYILLPQTKAYGTTATTVFTTFETLIHSYKIEE
jgi:hypothetical protein